MAITKLFNTTEELISPPSTPEKEHLSPTQMQSPDGLIQWNVRVLENGKVDCLPTPQTRAKMKQAGIEGDLIYRFKKADGRRYFGSVKLTEYNNLSKRFSNYKTRINGDNKKRHIEAALSRSPHKFTVKIVCTALGITERDLLELEEDFQIAYQVHDRRFGYNVSYPTQEPLRTGHAAPQVRESDPARRLDFSAMDVGETAN